MAFDDLKQANIDAALGWHASETIEYRSFPEAFSPVDAVVIYEVINDEGLRIQNLIEVQVSRSAIPSIQVGRDEIRMEFPKGSGTKRVFSVLDVVRGSHDGTFFRMRAKLT